MKQIIIDAKIDTDNKVSSGRNSLDELAHGAGKYYEMPVLFIKTVGGWVSQDEIVMIIYNTFKDKSFRITLDEIPDGDIKPHTIPVAFMGSLISGD